MQKRSEHVSRKGRSRTSPLPCLALKEVYFNHPAVHRAAGVFGVCCKAMLELTTHMYVCRSTANLITSGRLHAEAQNCK